MNKNKKTVEIFWTGGFDSTFRVVQLSRMNITVQPYYLSDKRIAESYELNVIEKITQLINAHPDTKAEMLPTIYVSVEDRPESQPQIAEAYKRIFKKTGLAISMYGSQILQPFIPALSFQSKRVQILYGLSKITVALRKSPLIQSVTTTL